MQKKLFILSPNDRYNYGDLLFSYIIKEELRDCYSEFVNIATIDNDLTNVGGEVVHSFSYLYNNTSEEMSDLILGGGESLLTDWLSCYQFISKKNILPYWFIVIEKICVLFLGIKSQISIRNAYGRYLLDGKSMFPYSISKNEIKNIRKIYYNSVGSAGLTKRHLANQKISELKDIDYLSVRDKVVYEVLREKSMLVYLVPDTAIMMSEIYSINVLDTMVSAEIKDYVKRNKYVLFQTNRIEGEKHYGKILDELKKVNIVYDFNLCLCPIGYAAGHDDPIVLSKLSKDLGNECSTYWGKQTIWEIMYLIANAQCYLGTSLHGVITAMSFCVPYVGLYRKKTKVYLATWGIDALARISESDSVFNSIAPMLEVPKDVLEQYREKQIRLVRKSFDNIKKKCNEQ